MKKLALIVTAVAALGLLSACEDDPYYYRHHDRMAMIDGDYDLYYDNYYGAITDGYWGGDGYFWYRDANNRYHRDTGRHMRHDPYSGYSAFHVHHSH